MTLNEIIRMAREANMDIDDDSSAWGAIITAEPADLERFAALVAAHEREACAKVCQEHLQNNGNAMECADAIRARGEK